MSTGNIRRTRRWLAVAATSVMLAGASCSILGADTLAVVAWSPTASSIEDPSGIRIWIEFSMIPDRGSVERAFALKVNGSVAEGRFSWSGARLAFEPIVPIPRGATCVLSVTTEAETSSGISLGDTFEFRFYAMIERERPRVASVSPEDGGTFPGPTADITVTFSEPIDMAEFLANATLSPSIPGCWTRSPEGTAFVFSPVAPYGEREYELKVASKLKDESGNEMPEDYRAVFYLHDDGLAPVLESVTRFGTVSSGALAHDPLDDDELLVNHGMNAGDELEFAFDEPVDLDSFKTCFKVAPDAPLEYVTTSSPSSIVRIKFGRNLEWGKEYAFLLKKGVADARGNKTSDDRVWYSLIDGTATRPPEALAVAFRPGSGTGPYGPGQILTRGTGWQTLDMTGWPDYTIAGASYIDLFVRVSPGSRVDTLSLMNVLSFSAYGGDLNTSVSIRATAVVADAESLLTQEQRDAIEPLIGSWEDVDVVRVMLNFRPGLTGNVLAVNVGAGLADMAGNAMTKAWVVVSVIN